MFFPFFLYTKRKLKEKRVHKMSVIIDEFIKDLKASRGAYKISTKPVIGWYCTYVPEEILYAAGFLPHRIMGDRIGLSKAKACLQGNLNPFVQSCLECALRGDYNYLNGIVFGNSDDATRRLYDTWKKYIKTPFVYFLDVPKQINKIAQERFVQELYAMIENIESHYKIKITKENLKSSIVLYNETRTLLKKLNDLRKEDNAPITSNQFLEIMKSANC